MTIPALIHAGDTVKWNQLSTDLYSSTASWVATFVLRHQTGNDALTLTGVADGSGGWNFTITAAQSAGLHPETHWWQSVVTKATERYTLGNGSVIVEPNMPASNNTFDGRSQAQQDLDALRAEMRARVVGGSVQAYNIGNRSLTKMPMPDLIALESKLKADVTTENRRKRIAEGLDSGSSVYIRFGR